MLIMMSSITRDPENKILLMLIRTQAVLFGRWKVGGVVVRG